MIQTGVYHNRFFEVNLSGIYQIEYPENNCVVYGLSGKYPNPYSAQQLYIGSTLNHIKRFANQHLPEFKKNTHSNTGLNLYYNLYKEDGFVHVVFENDSLESRKYREIQWINFYKSTNPEILFNCGRTILDVNYARGERHHMFNKKMPEDQKRKISNSLKGKPKNERTKQRIGLAHKGRIFSEETKAKMSNSRKGRKLTPEWINKIKSNLPHKVKCQAIIDDNVVAEFDSIADAANWSFLDRKIVPNTIRSVLIGKSRSGGKIKGQKVFWRKV